MKKQVLYFEDKRSVSMLGRTELRGKLGLDKKNLLMSGIPELVLQSLPKDPAFHGLCSGSVLVSACSFCALPFPPSLSSVLALQAFVPPCVVSVVTQSCNPESQTAAAENVVLQARASLPICLTVIVFEKRIDTYTAFSSTIPVLLYFKMVLHSNLDSLNCKRTVLEKGRKLMLLQRF